MSVHTRLLVWCKQVYVADLILQLHVLILRQRKARVASLFHNDTNVIGKVAVTVILAVQRLSKYDVFETSYS